MGSREREQGIHLVTLEEQDLSGYQTQQLEEDKQGQAGARRRYTPSTPASRQIQRDQFPGVEGVIGLVRLPLTQRCRVVEGLRDR